MTQTTPAGAPAGAPARAPVGTRLAGLVWARLPSLASRASALAGLVLADGAYLRAWPWPAVAAPAVSFLAGAVLGRIHPEETFTGALWVTGPMVVLAAIGAALGFWIWFGYVLADFFLYPHGTFLIEPVTAHAGLLPTYLLLAMLVVVAPSTTHTLVRLSLPRRARLPSGLRRLLEVVLTSFVAAVVVYAWTQTAPVLVRPAYTWVGQLPTNEAIQPVQATGWFLVFLAAVMGAVRPILQQLGERRTGPSRIVVHRPSSAAAWPVALAVQVTLAVLLLSGAFQGWLEAVLTWAALALVLLARRLLGGSLAGYARLAGHVPVLVRIAMAVVASYFVGRAVIGLTYPATSSFRPVLLSAVLSLVVFTVLVPEWARRRLRPGTGAAAR